MLAISAGMGSPAGAQTDGEQAIPLEQIIVTGESADTSLRVTEGSSPTLTAPLINTPRNVTVVTERQIEERGATSLESVLRTTPGVTLGSGEGGTVYGLRPFVRGFEATSDITIDGVRSTGRQTPEAFNLEAVEVNLGASSAASGRGATGGSINLVTKRARPGETFNDVSVLLGNASQFRTTYDGNLDFGAGRAARLNLLFDDSGVPGRDVTKDQKIGIATDFTMPVGEASRLRFSLSHLETDGIPDFGVPLANAAFVEQYGTIYGAGTLDDPFRPIGSIDRDNFYGFVNRDFRESEAQTASVEFSHDFANGFTLTSSLSFLGTYQDYFLTRPGYAGNDQVDAADRAFIRNNHTQAFATNVSGTVFTGAIEHSLSFGVELSRERIGGRNYAWSSSNNPVFWPVELHNLYNPNPWVEMTGGPTLSGATSYAETDTRAIYLFDTVTLNEQWLFNLGLRFDSYDLSTENYSAAGAVTALNRKDDIFNYQLGVVYKPRPEMSIYASYATSSTPAGEYVNQVGNNLATGNLGNATVDSEPEESENIEIGAKWDVLGGGLSLTGAIFQTEKTNQRVSDGAGGYDLTGATRARGFEIGAAGQINDRWAIFAGYTYLDVEVIDEERSGLRPINTAKNTLGLWTTYDVNNQFRVGGGLNFVDDKFGNNANTVLIPSYWRVDVMAAYQINDQAEVQLNINNLFDETYYDSTHQTIFATMAPGRSATATLRYRF